MHVSEDTMDTTLSRGLLALMALLAQTFNTAHAASSLLEATGTVNNGCSFGTVTQGSLGQSSNMGNLSTDISGGTRPSVVLHIVGAANFAASGTPVWTRDGAVLTGITTTSKVYNAASAGSEYVLPWSFTSPGMPVTLYWSVAGLSGTAFQQAGVYKASTTFTCY